MEARTLHCSSCGAAVSSHAPVCQHCGARLATIACPACFNMMFLGSKFCPHCGAAAARWQDGPANLLCPGCEKPLLRGELQEFVLHECGKCFGLWVANKTFEHICRTAEKESFPLASAAPPPAPPKKGAGLPKVRYLRCPECRKHMNRVNFAEHSGVVLDVCRDHGTWFDAHELQRIVQFIREGGMDRARDRKQRELAEERRRLEATRLAGSREPLTGPPADSPLFPAVVRMVGGWLRE